MPVRFSAKVAKMNTLAAKLSLDTITLACGTFSVKLSSKSSSLLLAALERTTCASFIGTGGLGTVGTQRVLRIPCHGRFIWPFAVAGLGLRYLVTPWAVRLGHPLR